MSFSDDPRIAVWQREMARIDANEPPPNFGNPPKRHHYVPEMYLRRFASDGGRVPRIACIDTKAGMASRTIGIHDAAVEKDFYSVETEDPRRLHEAEHLIGVFEAAAGHAFQNLDRLGSDHFPDDVDRENLAMFMALQFVRGPDTGDFQSRAYTQICRMTMRVAAASPEVIRGLLEEQGKDSSEEAIARAAATLRDGATHLSVSPHRNETVAAVLDGATDFMTYFFNRRWRIARSPIPLLTSDRPILLLKNQDPSEAWRGVGVANADTIVFPIDRRRTLVMRQPDSLISEGVVDIPEDFARRLNGIVVNHARRWIFHHPDDAPLDGAFKPNPPSDG